MEQPPDVEVHRITYVPEIKPVIVVVGSESRVIAAVFGPLTCVHCPAPETIVFPAKVADTAPHKFWSGPAVAVVGAAKTVILTSSDVIGQAPLEVVHLKTYVPAMSPVIVVFGSIVEVIVAVFGPLICDHVPTPGVGLFPAIVATDPQTAFWSAPAFAMLAFKPLTTIISSRVEHVPLVICH